MELAQSVADGLALCSEALDSKAFATFAEHVCGDVIGTPNTPDMEPLGPLKFKQALAAMCSLLLEAARHDATSQEITSFMEEAGVNADHIASLLKCYHHNLPAFREVLNRSGFSFPKVVDIQWRLDQHIRSSNVNQVRKPVYFVTLKTQQQDGSVADVNFTANLQELTDLVRKLKDALKQAGAE